MQCFWSVVIRQCIEPSIELDSYKIKKKAPVFMNKLVKSEHTDIKSNQNLHLLNSMSYQTEQPINIFHV